MIYPSTHYLQPFLSVHEAQNSLHFTQIAYLLSGAKANLKYPGKHSKHTFTSFVSPLQFLQYFDKQIAEQVFLPTSEPVLSKNPAMQELHPPATHSLHPLEQT